MWRKNERTHHIIKEVGKSEVCHKCYQVLLSLEFNLFTTFIKTRKVQEYTKIFVTTWISQSNGKYTTGNYEVVGIVKKLQKLLGR